MTDVETDVDGSHYPRSLVYIGEYLGSRFNIHT